MAVVRGLSWVPALSIAFLAGCGGGGDSTSSKTPNALSVASGNNQSGAAGAPLSNPVVVRVGNSKGAGLAGVTVALQPDTGSGLVTPASAVSGPSGTISVTWTLGAKAGSQTLRATAGGLSTTATASAIPGAVSSVTAVSGSGQTAVVGTPVPLPLVARVTDAFDNPKEGEAVTFAVATGGGTLTGASQLTDAQGLAQPTQWVLGLAPGFQAVTASVPGATPVTFFAVAAGIPPTTFQGIAGLDQTANVGTLVPILPTVQALDASNRPMPGVDVEFLVTSGGGTVTGGVTKTDAQGAAHPAGWVLGLVAGPNTLIARTPGVPDVTFSATGVIPIPATVAFVTGTNQSGFRGNYLAVAPTVRITDASGQPVAGATVAFATPDGGTLALPSATTDFDGVASALAWRLGPGLGPQFLTATTGPATGQTTTTATAPPARAFTVEVRFLTPPPTQAIADAFAQAADRWSTVVLGDLPDIPLNNPTSSCPATTETIDDVVIFANVTNIDGPGNILGQAGPCLIRSGSPQLTITGMMEFDTADLNTLAANGLLQPVILHEMGHVLGIGTLWSVSSFSLLVGAGTNAPFFSGRSAIAAFRGSTVGGVLPGEVVPVENSGGPGTRDGHWRESILGDELMTGFIDAQDPLSAITINSLRDMGYVVDDTESDPFTLFAALRAVLQGNRGMVLREGRIPGPIVAVDRNGRVTRTIPRLQ